MRLPHHHRRRGGGHGAGRGGNIWHCPVPPTHCFQRCIGGGDMGWVGRNEFCVFPERITSAAPPRRRCPPLQLPREGALLQAVEEGVVVGERGSVCHFEILDNSSLFSKFFLYSKWRCNYLKRPYFTHS